LFVCLSCLFACLFVYHHPNPICLSNSRSVVSQSSVSRTGLKILRICLFSFIHSFIHQFKKKMLFASLFVTVSVKSRFFYYKKFHLRGSAHVSRHLMNDRVFLEGPYWKFRGGQGSFQKESGSALNYAR
jgi:hypothetical protein